MVPPSATTAELTTKRQSGAKSAVPRSKHIYRTSEIVLIAIAWLSACDIDSATRLKNNMYKRQGGNPVLSYELPLGRE
jgi:hypothetical protein